MLIFVCLVLELSARPVAAAEDVLLEVPYRSQLDGSPYAGSNCGPASLGMVLEAYGVDVSTVKLRALVNDLQGTWDVFDSGTAIENIAGIARRYELRPTLRRWTLDEVRASLDAGVPIVAQVWYPALPGRRDESYRGDHFIVLIGYRGDTFFEHDPIHVRGGPGVAIRAEQLELAWTKGDLPWSGVALAGPPENPMLKAVPTPAPLPTLTPIPTATPIPPTATPSPTASPTATPSPTATATPSPTVPATAAIVPAATLPDRPRPAGFGYVEPPAFVLGWALFLLFSVWLAARVARPGRAPVGRAYGLRRSLVWLWSGLLSWR